MCLQNGLIPGPEFAVGRRNPQSNGSGRRPANPSSIRCHHPISSSPSCQQRSTVSPWCSAGKSIRPLSRSFTCAPYSVISSTRRASRRATPSTSAVAEASSAGGMPPPLPRIFPSSSSCRSSAAACSCRPATSCSTSGLTCSSAALASSGVKWRIGRTLCCAVVETEVRPAPPAPPRQNHRRLAFWGLFVGLIAVLNYAARFSGGSGTSRGTSRQEIYSYSTFAGGTVVYAVWLGLVLLIAIDRFDLLALRSPRSWGRALKLGAAVIVGILVWESLASFLPLPESPGKEQGITNVHWEPAHAGAFAANFVLFAVIAPFVEELTFRGAGQSLLRFLGRAPSILLVGIAFGLAHGLLEALLVLVPFGIALAWLRDRTGSVLPGMFVHALFNGADLAAAVLM